MRIDTITYLQVKAEFEKIQPDLVDSNADYLGCWIDNELVGIVSWVEQDSYIYLCHDHVKKNFRGQGIYRKLHEARQSVLLEKGKLQIAFCNDSSLKTFLDNGFMVEKNVFKVIK